jgi:hypothetical protein
VVFPRSSSSRSSITSGIFCFFDGFVFLENNDELFLKDEMFSPISLNSLSCSWWAPMTNDEGKPEESFSDEVLQGLNQTTFANHWSKSIVASD